MDIGGLLNALFDQLVNDWPSLLQQPLGLYIVSMAFVIGMLGISLHKALEKHG